MKQVGYVYSSTNALYIEEQIYAIRNYGIKNIVLDEESVKFLKSGDELVIYELKSLGKTVIQLSRFILFLKEKKINLIIIKKERNLEGLTIEQFEQFISELSEMERFVVSERTTKGIKKARNNGRVGGRPKITEQQIENIKYLYHNQSNTLREIAEKCGVSLGTAYKYAKKNAKE